MGKGTNFSGCAHQGFFDYVFLMVPSVMAITQTTPLVQLSCGKLLART